MGRHRNYVGIASAIPQVADDLPQRKSRRSRANALNRRILRGEKPADLDDHPLGLGLLPMADLGDALAALTAALKQTAPARKIQ